MPAGFPNGGQGTLCVYQYVNGSATGLAGLYVTVADGANLRSVVFGNTLWVFLNNILEISINVNVTTGSPGIGGYGMTGGSGFTSVKLGHHDVVAPTTVAKSTIASSVTGSQVLMRWAGALDDPNGIGTWAYFVFRSGAGNGWQPITPEFTDNTVAPGTTYTYQIYTVDQHGNVGAPMSSPLTTPPAGAIDPRRVGMFTTGSYWGGGGEQIDTSERESEFLSAFGDGAGADGWTVPVKSELQLAELAAGRFERQHAELATGRRRGLWIRMEGADRIDYAILRVLVDRRGPLRL